ncbi:Ig-like domain-containing protein, partial [Cellulophaga sp. E6(2014)]|uniref:Ig-like domain-containing protein n=1 Tax=Cellulophaga sp. E6(2014) TaxID=1495334 RepID=UPI00051D9DFD
TALSPTITHTGASINPASGVVQDFTSPVEYTVTAADGTTQVYTVTVNLAPALSSDKDITSFSIDGEMMNDPATTFTITLPAGTDVTALSPTIVHEGNSINPASGVVQDFTSPFEYTVTAADGTTQVYTVTVIAVNEVPVANDFNYSAEQDSSNNSIDVASEISDGDGDTLTVTIGSPLNGTAAISGTIITYSPTSGYSGNDQITYTINDGNGGTNSGTISITVNPAAVNEVPVANDFNYSAEQDSSNNSI